MVVVPAFGDVRVAASLRAAMTAARMVARLAGPLPLGETADTRMAQVAADVRLEETGMLRRTIGAGPTGSRSGRCAEPSDGLDGAHARLWGRLFNIVDEYLREDRPR